MKKLIILYLFVPEHRLDNTCAAKATFAFGHYKAIGFSPFSIENVDNPEEEPLGKVYNHIDQLAPLIGAGQEQNKIDGVLLTKKKSGMNFKFRGLSINMIFLGEFNLNRI